MTKADGQGTQNGIRRQRLATVNPQGGRAQDQTRRQWLAGLAMQAMIANPKYEGDVMRHDVTCAAYSQADDMLAFEAAEEKKS